MSEQIQKTASVGASPLARVLRIVLVVAVLGYCVFLLRSFGFL